MNPAELLSQPLTLKNGAVIPDRFAKSAMSETLGTMDNRVTRALPRLYRTWAEGGVGLSVTGNVMIDRRHIGEPRNVVLEDERDFGLLQEWAREGSRNGCQLWMQLNHPGKQSPKMLNKAPVSPSAVPEIEEIIRRFASSAAIAEKAGFTGVQIHGAHGYLVSQFLSPHHNQREDAPLMVTGGFRTESGMAEAIALGATALVGLARRLAVEPDLPKRIMAGERFTSSVKPIRTGIRMIDDMALMEVSWYTRHLGRMGKGNAPRKHDRGLLSLMEVLVVMTSRGVRTRLRAGQ